MSLMDEMKKPGAFGLTAGLLVLIVLGAIFSGLMSVVLIVIAYFVGNAAGAAAMPDVFGRRPPVISKANPTQETSVTEVEHGP